MPCKIIAHRGASGYTPENTLPAFQLAVAQRADGVELDVHRTKDGVLVISHDPSVDRTTNGHGFICNMTFAELRKLSAGYKYGRAFVHEPIPTLGEVLSLLPAGMLVNVEIKNGPILYEGIEQAVAAEISPHERRLKIAVSSFHHPTLRTFHKVHRKCDLGLLYEGAFINIWDYVKAVGLHVKRLHPNIDFVTPEFVEEAHARGFGVYAYTANTQSDIERMAVCGVDGIFTNYPDVARSVLTKL